MVKSGFTELIILNFKWKPNLEKVRIERRPQVLTAWYAKIAQATYDSFKSEHMKPGKGRVYSRGGRKHRASAAGDTPAHDTGRLLRGTRKGADASKGYVGTNVYYAKYLLGTVKMAPRKMYDKHMIEVVRNEGGASLAGYLKWTA